MIICFLWWGKTTKAKEIIDQLNPWTQSTHISPLVFILWSCAIALYHSVQGEMDSCVKTIEKALNLAEQTGLHAFDFLLSAQVARCSLMAGELQEAESWLSLMAKTMRSHSHIDGAFYHHLQSNAAAQRKNWQQAIEHARTGIAMSIDAGTPFPEAHCHINLARALIEQGDRTSTRPVGWATRSRCRWSPSSRPAVPRCRSSAAGGWATPAALSTRWSPSRAGGQR